MMRAKIRTRRKFDPTMLLAQAILLAGRGFARWRATFGDPRQQEKALRFLEKSAEIRREGDAVQALARQGKTLEALEAMRAMRQRLGEPDDGFDDRMIAQWRAHEAEMAALKQIKAETEGDPTARAARCREYVAEHPDSSTAQVILAGALRQQGDLEAALEAARDGLRLDRARGRDGAMERLFIADVLKDMNRFPEAIAELRSMLEEKGAVGDHLKAMVWLRLGDTYEAAGDEKAARVAWKEATRRDRSDRLTVHAEAEKRLRSSKK